MTSRSIVLQEERSGGSSVNLWASISENGDMVIEGQDLGRIVSEFWGSSFSEYEWIIKVEAADIPRLIAVLGGTEGEDTLSLLAQRYAEDSKYASKSYLEERGVTINFWSRVGD